MLPYRAFLCISFTIRLSRLSARSFCKETTAQIAAGSHPTRVICRIRHMIPVNTLPLSIKERKGNKMAIKVMIDDFMCWGRPLQDSNAKSAKRNFQKKNLKMQCTFLLWPSDHKQIIWRVCILASKMRDVGRATNIGNTSALDSPHRRYKQPRQGGATREDYNFPLYRVS